LVGAAEQLIDAGCISDVRVLQNGRVVTGVAYDGPDSRDRTSAHRVYIRYRQTNANSDSSEFEGECSCGERSPCIHVTAVAMSAAKRQEPPRTADRRTEFSAAAQPAPALAASTPGSDSQQRLCYLLRESHGTCELSIWVTQMAAGSRHIPVGACAFAQRTADGRDEYPRYVAEEDREILKALPTRQTGPWELRDADGFAVLHRVIATHRALWRTPHGHTLRWGAARHLPLSWQALPSGDQRLHTGSEALRVIVGVEPAMYVDTASDECGVLHLPYPVNLLRQYWNRPAVVPERVAQVIEHLAQGSEAEYFPRPRAMRVQREPLSSLRGNLVLSAGPQATLYFLYNDHSIDSRSLRADDPTVRHLRRSRIAGKSGEQPVNDDVILEFQRDVDTERTLRQRVGAIIDDPPQGCDAWLSFMMNGVPALRDDGWCVTIAEDFPYRIAAADRWYADLAPNRRQDWFDLQLGVMIDGERVNLLPAVVEYLQSVAGADDAPALFGVAHLFVPLPDGRHLPVATQRIRRLADTLVELLDRHALNTEHALALPVSQAGRVAQLMFDRDTPAVRSDDPSRLTLRSHDPSLLTLIEDLQNFSAIQPLPAPSDCHAALRPYQQEGLGWLQFLRRHRLGGVLADDMGLGKTVQTLAHLAMEKAAGRLGKPALIVAPVSVLGNWEREIRRFTPGLTALTLHGAKRKFLFAAMDTVDIVVTGYPSLLYDSDKLLARAFSVVILDEAQNIKNPRAKVSQVARALRAEHRLCLTGTPMENHLGDLWSLFEFVQPGLLGSEHDFQRRYRTPIEKGHNEPRAAALRRRIAPFLLRRTKDAVARELPPKTLIVESIVLDDRQRDFYDAIRLSMQRRVQEAVRRQGLARSRITLLDALLKLRQACCDPRLVARARATETDAEEIPSAKLDWLATALPALIADGRRILLFSQFTSMLRLIETVVTGLSIPYCVLTGETRNRTELIERFQSGEVPLFLISLKAGGAGLNLTAADTVIHYDPWWNPAAENQATDRAHRIGQKRAVFVYKLIAQGTVEERIMRLQVDKQALVSQLYTATNAAPSLLTTADLEALFAP